MEPAAPEGRLGLLGLAPVALAQLGRSVDDLAGGAVGHVLAVLADDPGLDMADRPPAGVHPALVFVGAEDGGERTDLGLAEAVVEAQSGQPGTQPLQHGYGHDRGPVVGLAQRRQVSVPEVRVVGESDPDGRRGEEAVRPARLDQVEEARRIGSVDDRVLGTDGEVGQQEDMHLRRVVERQGVHRPVVLVQAEGLDRARVLVDQGAVGHHRALGQGGGARGVEQLDEVPGVPVAVVRLGCGERVEE